VYSGSKVAKDLATTADPAGFLTDISGWLARAMVARSKAREDAEKEKREALDVETADEGESLARYGDMQGTGLPDSKLNSEHECQCQPL